MSSSLFPVMLKSKIEKQEGGKDLLTLMNGIKVLSVSPLSKYFSTSVLTKFCYVKFI